MLERFLGVQVSEETVRRLAEQAGGQVETAQTAVAQAPWQEEPAGKTGSVRLAMSAAGAFVPLVKGEWAEVRTLAIGEVEEQRDLIDVPLLAIIREMESGNILNYTDRIMRTVDTKVSSEMLYILTDTIIPSQ